jgi:hypothetical protein
MSFKYYSPKFGAEYPPANLATVISSELTYLEEHLQSSNIIEPSPPATF